MAKGKGSVNKVILVGNCGADPEQRPLPSGDSVVNLSLATTEVKKDRQSGNSRDHTEWHRLVFFGKLAEIVARYVRKGAKIYVEGSLRTRKWKQQDGQDRYSVDIIVNEMTMLGGRDAAGQGGSGGGPDAREDRQDSAADQPGADLGEDEFEDDIPF